MQSQTLPVKKQRPTADYWQRVRRLSVHVVLGLLAAPYALAADIHVITSGGFTQAYKELVPLYEKATPSDKVISAYGASMGNAPDAIPNRLARGERADIVILAKPALEKLIQEGKVEADSRVDLVRSLIGAVVRSGAPRPDISSLDGLKKALLEAPSIAYSASASGTYLSTELFQKLGLQEQLKDKAKRILSERVGTVVARGDAAMGFQQVSELLPIAGVDFIGLLPPEAQRETIFSAGILKGAPEPAAARALLRYLSSEAAAPIIRKTGLEPITQTAP